MIKINRDDCPSLLNQGYRWDNERCKTELVETLHTMQHGKCCYCEKKIGREGHGQAVEHFRPKATDMFPELENNWTNLLHACSCCNGKKANLFPTDSEGNHLLIDPSEPEVDPEEHLEVKVNDDDIVNFGRILPKNSSEKGDVTIETIGLDRIQKRHERCSGYYKLYSAYIDILTAGDETTKNQKIQAFDNMLLSNNEHAAFARSFARWKKLDSRFGVRIALEAEI